MTNDSGFRRTPSDSNPSSETAVTETRGLWEWDLDDQQTENVLRTVDNPALRIERFDNRQPPSFNPYDNGRGTKRR
jgi:hypothetical protein